VLARENTPKPIDAGRLSRREQQVVALAALGRTNKLIAYELGLAESTVAEHLRHAAKKLGARSRAALLQAIRRLSHGRSNEISRQSDERTSSRGR